MITFEFKTEQTAEEFENWLINGGFSSFAGTFDDEVEVEAVMVSPRYAEGITLTGAD